jgi:membrane associated rhomboid family serine protease
MGIYDRDYYRREGYSFLGSFTERGTICKWLVGINIVCFIIQLVLRSPAGNDWFTDSLDLNAELTWHGQVWRLLTYAFLHDTGNPWHIIFNMLFLWWFGSDVEDLYGPREFLAIYLVSAVMGGLAFLVTPLITGEPFGFCIGASGAVTAVLVIFACHFPTRIILVAYFLPVPIWLFVIFSVAYDGYRLMTHSGGQVAVSVHVGGAAFAFAYYKLHWRLIALLPNIQARLKRRSQPRLRVYREMDEERPAPVSVTASPPPPQGHPDDEQLEAKMDAVLEKISRFGKENLTDGDREVLRRAAEAIKRRRS